MDPKTKAKQVAVDSESLTLLAGETVQEVFEEIDVNFTAAQFRYSGETVYTGVMPTAWTDLDLTLEDDGVTPTGLSGRCIVLLSVSPDAQVSNLAFRENGETKGVYYITDGSGAYGGTTGCATAANQISYALLITDDDGVIEWDSGLAGSGGTVVKLLAYQALN